MNSSSDSHRTRSSGETDPVKPSDTHSVSSDDTPATPASRPPGSSDAISDPTVVQSGPVSKQSKPFDQIMDLLQRLMSATNREGSLGRIDNYEVLNIVGQGAMGIVLRAFDDSLQRIVAIKLMAPHLLTSANAKDRFNREARSAAAVSHPNVVTIHSVSEVKGVPYLVMEFIDGQSLEQRIRVKPFDTPDVLRIAHQMASGLSAAHRQGLIHRDIKPSNIMLEDSIERVRIADFGLARVAMEQSGLTSDGNIVGTPAYMSPEQVNGEHLDPRSDLFSVGCVMYSMLTGHSPFEAKNGLASWRAVLTREPEPLQIVRGSAPLFLCELVHRLLKKDPAQRFQSADELANELGHHLRAWNSSAETPTIQLKPETEKTISGVNRNIVLATFAGVAIAAAAMWPFVSPWTTAQQKTPEGDSHQASTSPISSSLVDVASMGNSNARPITVCRDGTARFVTLTDAIAATKPGGIIQILDEGPYAGSIGFSDTERLRGVKIIGRDTIVVSEGVDPIIRVANVPDLQIEGLVLNISGSQHGIEIVGNCPGLSVQKCILQLIDPGKPSVSLVYLHQGAGGTTEKPITLRNLNLRFGGVGMVLNERNSSLITHDVQITDCQFAGTSLRRGIPVILFDGVQNIQVTRNLMERGESALSLSLERPNSVNGFDFSWNTLHSFDSTLQLNESQSQQIIRFHHNLLLDVVSAPPAAVLNDQIIAWFNGNVWEHLIDEQQGVIDRISHRQDQISLISTTPGNSDYLVPTDTSIKAGRNRWQAE